MEGGRVLYLQYNSVRNDPRDPLPEFARKVFAEWDKAQDAVLVIDVRWNGGGNTFLSQPLLDALWARPGLSKSGDRLYVITGRNTYSAAQNFATDIDRSCRAIFVGEPTGSGPNFIGESIPFSLPYSRMSGTVSDLFWQRGWPMDDRVWIAPDLPAPPTLAAVTRGVDPALEAVLAAVRKRGG
jgi:hypothetical protein